MNIKQDIQQGEAVLKSHRDTLEKIKVLEEKKDDKAMLEFLVAMYKADYEGKCLSIEARLSNLKKQRIIEFEKESAEANAKMDDILKQSSVWFGKEPLGITKALGDACASVVPFMDQEKKNDLYFEIKGHLIFLSKTYQKK